MTTSLQPFQPHRPLRSTSLKTYAPGAAFIDTKAPVHAHKPGVKKGFTRRHPFWSLAIFLIVIGASGLTFVLNQALSTVNALHSVSTPPPSVAMPAVSFDDQPQGGSAVAASPVASPIASPIADPVASPIASPVPAMVDTSIARDQVELAGGSYDDDGGVVSSIVSGASDVGGLAEGVGAAAGTTDVAELEPITIMLMGVDARPGDAIDVGVNSDVLAVAHLNPQTGSCRILNIPRDSRVDLPGYGLTKINHALAVGGIPYQQLVVENFLNIEIDNYALIDFNGIISLVDSLGGVEIEITESFYILGTQFDPGVRTLDGLEALRYSRFRGGADGDFGRIRRQQQVVKALIETAAGTDPANLVRNVLPQIDDHIRTDLEPVEMVHLGKSFRTRCTEETLVTMTLSGTAGTFWDPLYSVNLYYVVIDEADKERKIAELMK